MQEKIIQRFRKGDKESYRLLFDMLYPAMCLFAKKFIYDYDDAEDITQDIFIELWNQRTKFESLNHIKSFLYLSVKNRCMNFKKHKLIEENYSKTTLIDNDPPFEESIIETEVIQNLSKTIEDLPEQQKNVIILSMKGLTNNEIAENMQISINTVKLHKKTAYKQLREKLGSYTFILPLLF